MKSPAENNIPFSSPNENDSAGLSPTVLQVIDQLIITMRADAGIPGEAIDRLEKLLKKGTVPRPDDINAALFDLPPDCKT